MDLTPIFKIASIALIISVISVILKQAGKEEYTQLVTLMGVVLALLIVIPMIQRLVQMTRMVFGL